MKKQDFIREICKKYEVTICDVRAVYKSTRVKSIRADLLFGNYTSYNDAKNSEKAAIDIRECYGGSALDV